MSSHAFSRPRLRTRDVWLLLAAAWFGLLLTAAGCRDTREDTSYCKTCAAEGAATADAGATGAQESAQRTPSSEASANMSQGTDVSTTSRPMGAQEAGTGSPNKGGSGSGATTAGNRAAAEGARDAGVTSTSNSSGGAGAAASSGNSGSATEGGRGAAANGGGNAPRDAGSGQEPAHRDAGHMEPLPCNGACPPERPVCDESTAPARCVQCTSEDNHACVGETKVCDGNNKCVQCTVDDLRGCNGELKACNPNNRCVRCTAGDPNSCPAAQPFCDNEQRCLECMPGTIGACPAGREVCNAEGRCIQCEDNTQCREGNFARCDRQTNTCVGCENDNDCSDRFPATPRCDKSSRRCVVCSPDGPPTCGPGMYCDPNSYICAAGSPTRTGCTRCNGPKECAQSPEISACVPTGNNESYCFDAAIGGNCHAGYIAQSVPDHPSTPYCLPSSMSSCPAINSALMGRPCTKDKEADCGKNGVCVMPTGTCSLKCTGDVQCPQPLTCKDNVCIKQ